LTRQRNEKIGAASGKDRTIPSICPTLAVSPGPRFLVKNSLEINVAAF